MALMLSRVGQNLIDFGLFSLADTKFPRLPLQLRATRRFTHERVHQQ
jgi:hypothetical protein